MNIELSYEEVETLIVSLDYSKQRVSEARETPYELRQEHLAKIEAVSAKIRQARNSA